MTIARTLMTERLTLRLPQARDLPVYTAYCASERAHFVRGPFTAPQAFDKFASIIGHWALRGFGRYVMELDGRPIGHVGPLSPSDEVPPEMTWTLWDGDCEGQGYATEAAQAVCNHLLRDEGWSEMLILVKPDNHGSVRIAERIGAKLTDRPSPDWYPGALTYRLTSEGFA